MIANIASDDALILPHHANPAGLNFRERQGVERQREIKLYQTEVGIRVSGRAHWRYLVVQ
jgi:hypothetical protein